MASGTTMTRFDPRNISRAMAGGVWLISVYTTYAAMAALAAATSGSVPGWAAPLALLAQAGLTRLESPVWRRQANAGNWTALVIDVLANIGGVYFLVKQLDQTGTYLALVEAFNMSATIDPLTALIISLVLGVLLAAAPEYLWRQQ